MKTNRRFGRPAFTLIELMAVITIIVILASLVVAGLSFVTERQAKEKARVQIALLTKALEDYKLSNGSYPASENSADGKNQSKFLFKALYWDSDDDGTGVPADTDQKIYLADLDPLTSKQGWTTGTPSDTTKITDPWGNEYRYRSALKADGTANADTINPDFDLWSVGKDGVTEGGSTAGNLKDPKNRDDIRNF
ncbi:MAG: type II secretion system protein GspG [Luteolibacter sp.]|uniref:type II secretion system protein GspG n=1 Tax=Luteolibacter sp. TaxID=1962973 RepID=UPI0032634D9B